MLFRLELMSASPKSAPTLIQEIEAPNADEAVRQAQEMIDDMPKAEVGLRLLDEQGGEVFAWRAGDDP